MACGRGVLVRSLADRRFALAAGDRIAVMSVADSAYNGNAISVEAGSNMDAAFVDIILFAGAERQIDCVNDVIRCAVSLELIAASDQASQAAIETTLQSDSTNWRWNGLSITAPTRPTQFMW
jgi:hypothetical protein